MKLVHLEVRNYRSIGDQTGDDCIELSSLNCLVGENNAGKSNVLKAVSYLMRGESDRPGLYYNHNTNLTIEVRGYFEVEDQDFDRLKIEEKKEAVQNQVLPDGTFGICRSSTDGNLKVLSMYPKEERLRPSRYLSARNEHWDNTEGGADFRDKMMDAFPKVTDYVEEGKETTKSAWKRAYNAFIHARPEDIDFIELPGPPKQGIPADLLNLLPEPLLVPAVKEVSDATRTSSRAEFGALLSAVSEQVQDELDDAIASALKDVSRQLNIVRDPKTGELIDDRHGTVQSLELAITSYVQETFADHEIELEFPTPRSSVLFDDATVWVREAGFGRVRVQDVGEGVKRILIFSLIRTLADLRHGHLSLAEEGQADDGEEEDGELKKPFLILYEEAELFLHPALQSILLDALNTLADAGDQVLFSTHSPFMVPTSAAASINIVRKEEEDGTKLLEVSERIRAYDGNAQRRLLGTQHLASYIFSERTVLVEGDSDRIILEKLAPRLDERWDFARRQIPIISVSGRDNIPIFREFLGTLGIHTFVMTDLDAARNAVGEMQLGDEVEEKRRQLLDNAGNVQEDFEDEFQINRDEADEVVWECTWSDLFARLRDVQERMAQGEEVSVDDAATLQRLLDLQTNRAIRKALEVDEQDVLSARNDLRASLLENDVLLLNGELEAYYPYPGGNKISAALEFDPTDYEMDEIREYFEPLPEDDLNDMERFLNKVFE